MNGMEAPWSADIEIVSKNFNVNPLTGLSNEEVKRRQKEFGLNRISDSKNPSSVEITVLRESKEIKVDIIEIVPGDIIIFEQLEEINVIKTPNGFQTGPIFSIPADARLIESKDLEVFETVITGSSTPAIKDASIASLPEDYSIYKNDMSNMVFSNTYLEKGYGKAIVVATNISTAIFKISTPLNLAKDLKKKLKKMEKNKKRS